MEYQRDDYLAYLTSDTARGPIFVELFGLLIGLEEEWRAQGASEDEVALTAFGFDTVRRHQVQVDIGPLSGQDEVVIADTAAHTFSRDRYGRTMQLCKGFATLPLPLEHPVTDRASWEQLAHWYAFDEARFAPEWDAAARAAQDDYALIVISMPGAFDELRQLMGEEALCVAYYEAPELIHDMLHTIGAMMQQILGRVTRAVRVDVLSVHEDLAGKSGPLVGPSQIHTFMAPYYQECWEIVRAGGGTLFQMDTDGNINGIIPALLDAGINGLYPMEPAAGMDMVQVRQQYGPRLAMMGGIDKHVLRQSPAAIRAELEYKLQPCMRTGGVVFGLDHRIPNGTPLDNYRYYVRTTREILGLEPNPAPGWSRMAF